jgi:arylsulfatase A-like enzyme
MNGWRTIVVGRYKLIQRTASRMMLYDLEEDPDETRDLAADRPLTLRYLRGLLGLVLAGAHHGHASERTEIDAETEAQLRALGYVGTSRPQ